MKRWLAGLLAAVLAGGCGGRPAPGEAAGSLAQPAAETTLPAESTQPADNVAFEQRLELQGVGFHVSSPNAVTGNSVTVNTTGLEIDNSPWELPADGDVIGAEVGDLDANGSPEIYVYVRSRGPDARGSLVGFAANHRKSLSAIYLPPLSDDPVAAAGYRGRDEFALVERSLARRFPLYSGDGDAAVPSGKTRQLQYRLIPGEAGWQLELVDSTEF